MLYLKFPLSCLSLSNDALQCLFTCFLFSSVHFCKSEECGHINSNTLPGPRQAVQHCNMFFIYVSFREYQWDSVVNSACHILTDNDCRSWVNPTIQSADSPLNNWRGRKKKIVPCFNWLASDSCFLIGSCNSAEPSRVTYYCVPKCSFDWTPLTAVREGESLLQKCKMHAGRLDIAMNISISSGLPKTLKLQGNFWNLVNFCILDFRLGSFSICSYLTSLFITTFIFGFIFFLN